MEYDQSLRRVTISVPADIAAKAHRAVESGLAESVSGYFVGLAQREPDWAQARSVLDEMIDEAGGIPDEARQWARAALGIDEDVKAGAA